MLTLPQAEHVAFSGGRTGDILRYGNGWVFFHPDKKKYHQEVVVVDVDGGRSVQQRQQCKTVVAAVAAHHGLTVEETRERWPETLPWYGGHQNENGWFQPVNI